MEITKIIDFDRYPLANNNFQAECRAAIDKDGVLVMKNFMRKNAVEQVRAEGLDHQRSAYFCTQEHNVYLTPTDPSYSKSHARNRNVISSKGCITDDQDRKSVV